MFDNPLTPQQAISSLLYRHNFKHSYKREHLAVLAALRGLSVGAGVQSRCYTIPQAPERVLLRHELYSVREAHAVKVIQLGLAGVLYDHAFNSALNRTTNRGTGYIVTEKTVALYEKIEQSPEGSPERAYWEGTEGIYENVVGRDYVSRLYPELLRRVTQGRLVGHARNAAESIVAAVEAAKRVPGLYNWINDCTFDTHGGNWRVRADNSIYLADGFV